MTSNTRGNLEKIYSTCKVASLLLLCMVTHPLRAEDAHHHAHGGEQASSHASAEKGPHGGKLLKSDKYTLEIFIFEEGTTPEFRLYFSENGREIDPEDIQAEVTLTRLGGKKERISFSAKERFLQSNTEVKEPHSFEVAVKVTYSGKVLSWDYTSFEGRTELSQEALEIAKITTAIAGPGPISFSTRVYGRLIANEDRVAHIGARYPGLVREIKKSVGDTVVKGDVLAIIESNQTLQPYEIRSLISGVILERHATLGEVISDAGAIFIVADLSQLWADFQIYRDDIGAIKAGQTIQVEFGDNEKNLSAVVSYVSPTVDEVTQSKLIRAVLPNPLYELKPGLFISGLLTASQVTVPIAVKREAIQTFRDWNVVFLTDGHTFQAVPVELGRKDSENVEILSGLSAGDTYVSTNSYIIKADIEKSGASHDH